MFSPYRGRSHTKKQNSSKTKISIAERKARTARKKLEKLFPHYKIDHPFYTKYSTERSSSPLGEGFRVRFQHHITGQALLKIVQGSWARRS